MAMNSHMKVMKRMENAELSVLATIVVEKGWETEELTSNAFFQKCRENGDYQSCADLIASEIRLFGGNTFANIMRGGVGPDYKEVACDVCEKLDVEVDPTDRMRDIDRALLAKVLTDMWDEMSDSERQELLESMNIDYNPDSNLASAGLAALMAVFKAGGFASYELAVIVVNAVARLILGRGLSLVANAMVTRVLGIVTGPIGMTLTALWLAADLAGPAYRVTIPAVIYLAAMREIYRYRRHHDDESIAA